MTKTLKFKRNGRGGYICEVGQLTYFVQSAERSERWSPGGGEDNCADRGEWFLNVFDFRPGVYGYEHEHAESGWSKRDMVAAANALHVELTKGGAK